MATQQLGDRDEQTVVPIVNVVLEVGGSRKKLSLRLDPISVVAALEKELGSHGKDGVIAHLSPNDSDTQKKVFLLQRSDKKFGFIDITEVNEIEAGDRLTFQEKCKSPKMSGSSRVMVSYFSQSWIRLRLARLKHQPHPNYKILHHCYVLYL